MLLRVGVALATLVVLIPTTLKAETIPTHALAGPIPALERGVFAFPGHSCPGGSEPYKGPEQMLASENNAVYCRFMPKVFVLPKNGFDKCPAPMKPYANGQAKPDDDVIWCEFEALAKFPVSPTQPK